MLKIHRADVLPDVVFLEQIMVGLAPYMYTRKDFCEVVYRLVPRGRGFSKSFVRSIANDWWLDRVPTLDGNIPVYRSFDDD